MLVVDFSVGLGWLSDFVDLIFVAGYEVVADSGVVAETVDLPSLGTGDYRFLIHHQIAADYPFAVGFATADLTFETITIGAVEVEEYPVPYFQSPAQASVDSRCCSYSKIRTRYPLRLAGEVGLASAGFAEAVQLRLDAGAASSI